MIIWVIFLLEALSSEGRRLETSWESKLDLLVVCAIGIKKYIFYVFLSCAV